MSILYLRVTELVAKAVEEEKDQIVAISYDGRHTLGFAFELYYAYCTQAKVRSWMQGSGKI